MLHVVETRGLVHHPYGSFHSTAGEIIPAMGSVRQFKPFTHSSKKYRVFSDNITTANCLNANFLRSPLAYDSVPFIYAHVLEISSQSSRQILGELNRRSARSILFVVMVGLYDLDIKPVT